MGEQDLVRVIVADIESLDLLHERINSLLGQIAETMLNNKYKLEDRGLWGCGLWLIHRMKKVEIMNAQKRDILGQIRKLLSETI